MKAIAGGTYIVIKILKLQKSNQQGVCTKSLKSKHNHINDEFCEIYTKNLLSERFYDTKK